MRRPARSTLRTACSMASASAFRPKVYRSIIAADRIVAIGLALSWPAMSGAEPWTGSYMPKLPVASEAEGSMPIEPVIWLASSERMSPKMLLVTMTSNCFGSRTSCIAVLSTYRLSSFTSG